MADRIHMTKKAKNWILITTAVIVLLILLFVLFRQKILNAIISKAERKIATELGMKMTIGEAHFSGITTVSLKNLRLYKEGTDTLLSIDTISAHPVFWRLFTGNVRINHLYCADARLKIVNLKSGKNYSLSSRTDSTKSKITTSTATSGYGRLLNEISSRAFDFAPQQAELMNLSLTVRNDSVNKSVFLTKAISTIDKIQAAFSADDGNSKWNCNGHFSQSNRTIDLTIVPEKNAQVLPILPDLLGLKISFNNLHVAIDDLEYRGGAFSAKGKFDTDSLRIYHARISDDQVVFPSVRFNYSIRADQQSLSVDSSSALAFGKINIQPFLKLDKSTGRRISIGIHTEKTNGTDFFQSLPAGMFDEVRDIEADGTLAFGLDFSVDIDHPDSVLFNTEMKKSNFRIRRAGELFKMNGEFTQQVFENGRYIRSFQVGPSNPTFTPYEYISQDFKNAVLTSEDGSFFYHNGFNEDAFRKSISTNIKAKKFLRGGSTISMQLVKNVFLTRKKTVARKAEEALIVWLIESNRIYSKERMFEVYLNIIELGPNIYGIGEASRFYFSKSPAEINLQEGIFLASLLPHPKWFRYSFDQTGNLKPYLADYYRVVSNFLLRKNLITQEQHDQLQPVIELKGPAKELVVPSDTIPTDETE